MNRYGKRCVLYPRVSTEMQVDGYSLEGQKNMLTRFADREEMIVVDTYEDAGKSGKSIEGRPAFQKMLRDIEDGLDIDYILVYKLSRFGRNAADILNSLELVQSYGVNLICIEEGIDSSQTSGKLLISVLSAVAEIERENIIEQTMNGRREKARQGGWNGGFAPYGYTLEDNKLMIEETEAVAIRKIFELYTSSEIGLGGIANQLNLQGIRKIPRQNGTLEDWTGHFIKLILDNPVYCGKIAYGRRTKEKVKGTKNDYQMKRNDDYILTEGQHKGIVSEEVWEKAHAKRLRTGVKQPSKIGRDRVHLLSGLLKCPVCGSPMYTNKHAWTNKDGTYKEIYYYVCSRNRMVRGKHCEYKAMLKKTDIEPMVIEAIREIVRNEEYAQAIKKRIGVQIDTKAVDKELEGYQAKLKEVDLNKTRLEREIDSLPADAKYRERKLHDMTLRLDSLYDVIVELEEKIEDAKLRRDAIKQQAITLENIYKIMVNFDCVYNIINDEEKRNVVTALIKEIEIYRNDESEYPLKRIGLNFPVFKDGGEVTELLWDKGNTVEAVALPSEKGSADEKEATGISQSSHAEYFVRERKETPETFVSEEELEEIFKRTYYQNSEPKSKKGYQKRYREEAPPRRLMERSRAAEADRSKPRECYLLVDGYNIIFSWEMLRELSKVNIESARNLLMDVLCDYQGFNGCTLILVFDAYRVEGGQERVFNYHNIHVVFTKEAETADQYIEKTVHKIGKKADVTVATSDALEQVIIYGQGARRMAARELLEEVELTREKVLERIEKRPGSTQKQLTENDHNYLFDHLPEELVSYMEEVRLGKREL